MKTPEQCIEVILDLAKAALGDPVKLTDSQEDVSKVWERYEQTWFLINKLVSDGGPRSSVTAAKQVKIRETVDKEFFPYFKAIQPLMLRTPSPVFTKESGTQITIEEIQNRNSDIYNLKAENYRLTKELEHVYELYSTLLAKKEDQNGQERC